ncbi:type IV pili twitching motility protein PilT [Halorhodospira abdelmalekii]|uniref:PilT/PilU family type 4a pilus ATPase n=1 Tax=Halorhodospira abdelmalekii TaxID=421629 RepID=UPI001905DCEA|nr:PilT/PilU family type 4a pilus ATPase [Halorhodospira abdelmalekii]MBK1735914.1 type IV pili twitching motility protein PilT [Halorhodospira abdelmalekii]
MRLQQLLEIFQERKGSDLFITVGRAPILKVDGRHEPLDDQPLSVEGAAHLVDEALNEHQQALFAEMHEANFAIATDEGARFRVSAFYQRGAPGMVIRRIETAIPSLESLNLPALIGDLALTKRGLILFVGGTGTGKSTSLAAMIGRRNASAPGHILTIEDPIEFIHPHQQCIVNQREVGVDTDSFDTALKNALRQAPDVILIGEIRSREIMDYAIAFAETGHLTLATLHANNANQALDRIINFFPGERRDQLLMDLSLNLKAVIAQQLIPRADQAGRVAALEVMLGTPLVQDKIRKGEVHALKEIMKASEEQGMQTFDRHLYRLYSGGWISYESALAYADSANEVRLMIKLGADYSADSAEGSEASSEQRGPAAAAVPGFKLVDD